MTLLLGTDPVTLFAASGSDGHGWALAGSAQLWQGTGNLQRSPGRSDPHSDAGGGSGPYDPRAGELATLYLPPSAPVADGLAADVGGRRYYLSQTRYISDPTGTAALDVWAATATESGQWPT